MKTQLLFTVLLALVAGFLAGFLGSLVQDNYAAFSVPLNAGAIIKSQPSSPVSVSSPILNEEEATIEAVKKVSPAVVSIIISKELAAISGATGPNPFPFSDFFGLNSPFGFSFQFPNQPEPKKEAPSKPFKQEIGGGSGFFVSADGLILTNKHVVEDESADYTVVTSDGKRYEGEVVARDPLSDLAFVRIKGKNFSYVALGDSDKIKIGQTVIAIGFALGEYRNTVTKGVISGIGRRVVAGNGFGRSEVLEQAIQTDAAINQGNSGGPLINLKGEVIGISTAVNFSGQLIGFVIPINQVKPALEGVKQRGKIVRPWLGVRYVLVTSGMAKKNNLSVDYGALIARGEQSDELAVIPGSPADKAGLVENDIILQVNNVKINEEQAISKQIIQYKPGDEINLKVLSKGKEKIVKVKLEEFSSK